jgi:hypothetical protein
MVWLAEKKVFRHFLDLGFERVEIPIRVKFEFKLTDGCLDPDSLSREILYNRVALHKRYPDLDALKLEQSIKEQVDTEILTYFKECGFLKERDKRRSEEDPEARKNPCQSD